MQPRFNRIEAGLPRTKANLQSHNSSPIFNSENIKHHYKCLKLKYTYTNIVWKKPQAMQACVESQRKKLTRDYYVAMADTMFSPELGIIPEGHCQPRMDPTPRTSQTEQRLAMQDYPWGS
jgi:hypothetical protein